MVTVVQHVHQFRVAGKGGVLKELKKKDNVTTTSHGNKEVLDRKGHIQRVDVIESRERLQQLRELLVDGTLGELDLTGVEVTDTGDFVSLVHNGRCLALCLRQNDVDKFFALGHHLNRFEVIQHHCL